MACSTLCEGVELHRLFLVSDVEEMSLFCLRFPDFARMIRHLDSGRDMNTMKTTTRLVLGILTALAMLGLTFMLPRGSAMRDAVLVQFPVTVGVWAIFVLLFVRLK